MLTDQPNNLSPPPPPSPVRPRLLIAPWALPLRRCAAVIPSRPLPPLPPAFPQPFSSLLAHSLHLCLSLPFPLIASLPPQIALLQISNLFPISVPKFLWLFCLKMSVRDISQERMASQERETPFAGYGDRVGSGVAYTPTQWKGGELVTDPALVNKSIKPRRFYYSPIGDGVVAADGVQLKRLPHDLTPKTEVIQQRIVEKSDRGRPGVRITEKTWSTGGPTEDSLKGYGHTEPPHEPPASGAGRGSRASEPNAFANLADQLGPSVRPTSAQSAPPPTRNGFGEVGAANGGAPKDWKRGPSAGDGVAAGHPKHWGDGGPAMGGPAGAGGGGPNIGGPYDASSRSTPLDLSKSPVANGLGTAGGGANDLPLSGRSSAASTGLYEPGMRYEIRKDYRVTNPRELIHQYATTTPVTVIDPSLETTRTITRQHYTQTVEESFGPFPPYTSPPNVPSPLKFVQQLRDETMTESQRQANRQQHSMSASSRDANFEQRVEEIRRSTSRQASSDPMVEQLSSRLQRGGGLK